MKVIPINDFTDVLIPEIDDFDNLSINEQMEIIEKYEREAGLEAWKRKTLIQEQKDKVKNPFKKIAILAGLF